MRRKEKFFLVYKIVNVVNDNFYIGVTSGSLFKRRREHLCSARSGSRYILHKAIRRYGEKNFLFEPFTYHLSMKDALAEEIRAIRILNPKYNLTRGGEGILGFQARLGMKNSEASKEKTRQRLLGHSVSSESRERMRQAKLNSPHYEKRKAFLSALKSKAIICISDGQEFKSAMAAIKHYGLSKAAISRVCRGKQKETKGLRFQWKDAV